MLGLAFVALVFKSQGVGFLGDSDQQLVSLCTGRTQDKLCHLCFRIMTGFLLPLMELPAPPVLKIPMGLGTSE